MNQFTDDDFKYSAAQFDVDYLESISSSTNSDLSRKSLFVKFDPLMSGQSPRDRGTTAHNIANERLKTEGFVPLIKIF